MRVRVNMIGLSASENWMAYSKLKTNKITRETSKGVEFQTRLIVLSLECHKRRMSFSCKNWTLRYSTLQKSKFSCSILHIFLVRN